MSRQVSTTEQYAGQYVAFSSRDSDEIVAAGKDPKDVFDKAKAKGVKRPVIAFIPAKDSIMIY